ncbi:J domain-containing protein DDB_G0295729 [Drosophila montana]|uniref:J domain-containing protein DDB_G0295729 n=1 Tax=Drosophila montana TaxID=40370 RepID=UPI00313C7F23
MIFAMATRCRSTKSLHLRLNRWLCLAALMLIFIMQLSRCEAQSQPRMSRRPAGKTNVEETSERGSVPDQLALAASRSDGHGRNYPRRGGALQARTKEATPDYSYGQLELNLIRPEHETSSLSPHGKISAYYGGGMSTTAESVGAAVGDLSHEKTVILEDSETAEEYVSNAMKMAYSTRHKESQAPLRIVANTQRPFIPNSSSSSSSEQQAHAQVQQQQQHHHHQQQQQQQQQLELEQAKHAKAQAQAQAALLEAQMQAELQAQLVQQQALLLAEQQRQQQQQEQKQHQQHQQQQQQQHQHQQQQHQQQQHQQQQHQQQHQQQQQHSVESTSSESSLPAPAPVYEKESVPRSYELYDTPAQTEPVGGDIERLYRTKYYSYPASQSQPQLYRNIEDEAEEKVRVSASTEIPKAEIMKQIEKSVIKYMKELEAEGKIITTPQELAPPATKTYYKLLSLPSSGGAGGSVSSEEKRYSSSTVRPKYSSPPAAGQGRQPGPSIQQHGQYHGQHHQLSKQNSHALTKPQRYQSETETAYQAPDISADALAPNVEFIYKIKTRAPLQTATVKTVSKPYTLPLKTSAEHFDHGAALKNIEEFDLSHVVTTAEREQEEQRVTSKPQKLYFNSDIYHDINSLPYKAEKLRGASGSASNIHSVQGQEYRHKLKAAADLHPDYKGYSGYFAEPASSSMELAEKQQPSGIGNDGSEEGYPLPYQYVLKKEPLSAKYEEERESWEQSMRLAHAKPAGGGYKTAASTSLEYDSYSPKFNNNPEGYGYQHTYKTQLLRGAGGGGGGGGNGPNSGNSAGGKRGKRGGAPHPAAGGAPGKKLLRSNVGPSGLGGAAGVGGKLAKDLEANLALRPPPKK